MRKAIRGRVMRHPTAYKELEEIEAPTGIEKGGVEAATGERW